MPIKLDKETQKYLLSSIKRFFTDEMEEEIGDLKAARVLEFVVNEIGPSIYNQAIADARAYLEEKASELSEARYQPEYDYWKKR
jgi:uncharacterized protein (DUF2164 family)